MNWEAVGAVSEALAAAAVVISLVYLALRVRDGTGQRRAAEAAPGHERAADAEAMKLYEEGSAEYRNAMRELAQ